MIILGLLRGPSGIPSIIGVNRCDKLDFVFLFALLFSSIGLTCIGSMLVNSEYKRKEEAEYTFVKGEYKFTKRNTAYMVVISLSGAFLVATCGIGPASFFNPFFLSLEMNAAVASGTSLYLTMLTAGAATTNNFVFHLIDPKYALIINILTIAGTLPGVYG